MRVTHAGSCWPVVLESVFISQWMGKVGGTATMVYVALKSQEETSLAILSRLVGHSKSTVEQCLEVLAGNGLIEIDGEEIRFLEVRVADGLFMVPDTKQKKVPQHTEEATELVTRIHNAYGVTHWSEEINTARNLFALSSVPTVDELWDCYEVWRGCRAAKFGYSIGAFARFAPGMIAEKRGGAKLKAVADEVAAALQSKAGKVINL